MVEKETKILPPGMTEDDEFDFETNNNLEIENEINKENEADFEEVNLIEEDKDEEKNINVQKKYKYFYIENGEYKESDIGCPNGYAKCYNETKKIFYRSYFKNNKITDWTEIVYSNNKSLIVETNNGLFNGYGEFYSSLKGDSYGIFKNKYPEILVRPSIKYYYTGTFKNGKKDVGRLQYIENGNFFEGKIKGNKLHYVSQFYTKIFIFRVYSMSAE